MFVAGFDLVWDVATAPVHLALYPRVRHPLYKATLAILARSDENRKIRYTAPMAAAPRQERERLPIADSPISSTNAVPPVPPEVVPPISVEPIGPEHQEHSPQREAFHQLMRDIFEVTEPALREDTRDRLTTTATLGERTAQAWQEFTKTPWNIPRHVRQFDSALRGRDLGSMRIRLGRTLTYHAIRAITTGVDGIEDIVKLPLLTIPGGGFISAGVEFLSDELIRAGTEWTVQQATQTRQVRFASPIAVAASRINNVVPIFGLATNAPRLETRMRNVYNTPIVGVPIEYLYTAANRLLTQIERNPRGQWMEQFVFAVLGGARREEAFRQEREQIPATPVTS